MESGDDFAARRALLARLPLFGGVPPEVLDRLVLRLRLQEVPARAIIVRQGEQGGELYLVEAGELAVTAEAGGKTVRLGQLGPGDFFGEVAVLRNTPRSATVTALTAARLWSLVRTDLAAIVRQSPVVLAQLRATMRQREVANALRALQ